jgi:DNA repair ATPase RecN
VKLYDHLGEDEQKFEEIKNKYSKFKEKNNQLKQTLKNENNIEQKDEKIII